MIIKICPLGQFEISLTCRIKRRERVLHLLVGMVSNKTRNHIHCPPSTNTLNSAVLCIAQCNMDHNGCLLGITNPKSHAFWGEKIGSHSSGPSSRIHRWCRLAELRTVFNSQEIAWDVFRILEHQADKCRLKKNEQGLKYREIQHLYYSHESMKWHYRW